MEHPTLSGFKTLTALRNHKNLERAKYISYGEEDVPNHFLYFTKDTIRVTIPSRKGLLFPEMSHYFTYTKINDTIRIQKINAQIEGKGIVLSHNLFEHISNENILLYSKNELKFIKSNKPYFRKEYVDSLTQQTAIIVFNDLIYVYQDSSEWEIFLSKVSSTKEKKILRRNYTVSILKNKEAYKKYGVLGLYGVVEYKRKKRSNTTNKN